MTRTLSEEVLEVLAEPRADKGPISLAYLARRFGVTSALMRSCAQQLVSAGVAEASMATRQGIPTVQGLLPQQQPVPTAIP
jgi:DNA-binding IclR family transcriptional regulator